MEETLFGVLVDVSDSMRSAYALDTSNSTSNDASVERIHAILTTIMKIVKSEVDRHCQQESIFACAFGLDIWQCGSACTGTCDLFSLFYCPKDAHQGLIDLAKQHGVREPEVERWIRKHLSQHEAQLLYMGLRHNPGSIRELKRLIINEISIQVIAGSRGCETATKMTNVKVDAEVTKLEAYRFAHKIIDSFWQQQLKPRRVHEVSEMLDARLIAHYIARCSSSLHGHRRVQEDSDHIKMFDSEPPGVDSEPNGVDSEILDSERNGACGLVSFDYSRDPYTRLIDLAKQNEVYMPKLETWLRKHLPRHKAQQLCISLHHNPGLIHNLKHCIEEETQSTSVQIGLKMAKMSEAINAKVDANVTKTKSYKYACKIVSSQDEKWWQQQQEQQEQQEKLKRRVEMLDTQHYSARSHGHRRVQEDFVKMFDSEPNGACALVSFNPRDPYERLINLANQNGACMPELEIWLKNHLSRYEAQLLYMGLHHNSGSIHKLKQLIQEEIRPYSAKIVLKMAKMCKAINAKVDAKVTKTKAYKYACEIISFQQETQWQQQQEQQEQRRWQQQQQVQRRWQQQQQEQRQWQQQQQEQRRWQQQQEEEQKRRVEEILDAQHYSAQCLSFLHDQIREFIEQIRPFIFGKTPMCKALRDASAVFGETSTKRKVLFLLSDGLSTDGDPHPIAHELCSLGVTIVTCFLTSDHIDNPRRLLYERDPSWSRDDGRQVLFEMSSTMKNTHTPISYLVDANWQLPPSGESRLFVQANSLDVVNEFCEIVVSQMKKHCDALVDILEKVDLATYINQRNTEFEPKQQEGGTCYANAIAAVFHLSMHRIVGREGGVPDFYEIRSRIIDEYGVKGANTESVLTKVCPEYRLHFKEVDETGARQAINKRRPVIATFSLYEEQWTMFSAFYRKTPMGILKKCNVEGGSYANPGGHAVVLKECAPNCLTFMNSWGQKFADGGFFRVEDESVLNDTKFYDVYWTLQDLKESETEAFKREGTKKAEDILQKFPSIQDLSYKCPKCYRKSKVGEFLFHTIEAECPKCHQKFKPTNKEIIESLYTQTHNL